MKNALLTVILLTATAAFAAQPSTPAPETTIRGVITVVKGNAITLAKGLDIDVSNAVVTIQGAAANRTDLAVGMRVRAFVNAVRNSGTLVATKVLVEGPDLTIIGTIDAATPASLTVAGQSISIDSKTVFAGFAASTSVAAAKDLRAGMPVTVDATSSPSGLSATRVVAIGPPPPAPPVPEAAHTTLTAAVAAVTADAWTVGSTTVYISPKTVITGAPKVGDTAVVSGIQTAEGAIIASTIRKQ